MDRCKHCHTPMEPEVDYRCGCEGQVIDDLRQQLAALRENISTYMDEAWHHDTCPRHDGSTFPACNCGFEMAVDALAQEDKK